MGVHTCVVLNVPAIVLKDVISVRSVLTSGSTVCNMIDALAPESRSVFNNLGVVEPLGFIISIKRWALFPLAVGRNVLWCGFGGPANKARYKKIR